MDSILVVCYSYTGVSKLVAQQLCAQRGWPLGEIADSQRRAGARGALRCLLDSALRRCPAIGYRGPDPADFRTVVLVSPIWLGRLCGPMRSFVDGRHHRLGRLAVVSTMNAEGDLSAVAEVQSLTGRVPVLGVGFTTREIASDTFASRLAELADVLQPGSAPLHQPAPAAWTPHRAAAAAGS